MTERTLTLRNVFSTSKGIDVEVSWQGKMDYRSQRIVLCDGTFSFRCLNKDAQLDSFLDAEGVTAICKDAGFACAINQNRLELEKVYIPIQYLSR